MQRKYHPEIRAETNYLKAIQAPRSTISRQPHTFDQHFERSETNDLSHRCFGAETNDLKATQAPRPTISRQPNHSQADCGPMRCSIKGIPARTSTQSLMR